MKLIKFTKVLTSLVLCFTALGSYAQKHSKPYLGTVGIHAGTQGIGVTGRMPITDQFGAHIGLSFLPFDMEVNKRYGSYDTNSDVKARFSNVHLAADWFPFYTKTNFFQYFNVSAGAAYFFKADGDFETTLTEDYHYGDIIVPAEDLGMLTTNISWKNSVAPYLGVGFNQIEVSPLFTLGFSLGSYYLSKPEVSMVGTQLLEENESNGPIIEKNAEDYRFLPVLQLNFSYKISR